MPSDFVLRRIIQNQEIILPRLPRQPDDFPDGLGAVAPVLVLHGKHNPPYDQAPLLQILVQHHEAHRLAFTVNRKGIDITALPVQPRLGQGIGIGGHEPLAVRALHLYDCLEIVFRYLLKMNHGPYLLYFPTMIAYFSPLVCKFSCHGFRIVIK